MSECLRGFNDFVIGYVVLEKHWDAALHGNGTGDAGYYGCKELKDFGDGSPIDFYHFTQNLSG